MSTKKEKALEFAQEVADNLHLYNPGHNVLALNITDWSVQVMKLDQRPNGWEAIFFGGCKNLQQIKQRINEHFER
jgi:hypothetical protein